MTSEISIEQDGVSLTIEADDPDAAALAAALTEYLDVAGVPEKAINDFELPDYPGDEYIDPITLPRQRPRDRDPIVPQIPRPKPWNDKIWMSVIDPYGLTNSGGMHTTDWGDMEVDMRDFYRR